MCENAQLVAAGCNAEEFLGNNTHHPLTLSKQVRKPTICLQHWQALLPATLYIENPQESFGLGGDYLRCLMGEKI